MGQQQVSKSTTKTIEKDSKKNIIKVALVGGHEVGILFLFLINKKKKGKTTICKQFHYLFKPDRYSNYRISFTGDPEYRVDLIIEILKHFQKAYQVFKKIKPNYDPKTERILSLIEGFQFSFDDNPKDFWKEHVINTINKIISEESFQNILNTNHEYSLGDSCSYFMDRIIKTDVKTKMDVLK